MTLAELIARRQAALADLLAQRQVHTDALARIRGALDADQQRDATADEATEIRSAVDARSQLDAQITVARGELDQLEAEQRADNEALELSRQVTQTDTGQRRESQRRTGGAQILGEARTYRPDQDPTGRNFLRDVVAAHFGGFTAQQRLGRHMDEERVERADYMKGVNERAAGTGAFAGLVVPQYLTDEYAPHAKAGRPLANVMRHLDLPPQGMTVNIGRVTTATSTAVVAENTNVSETNIDDTLLSPAVQMIAGSQTLSRAAVERGSNADEVTISDLMRNYGTTLDSTVINQATNGLTNVATNVAYTDASPTAAELYPKILGAWAGTAGALLDQAAGDVVAVMRIERWAWLQSQLSSTFPLIGQGFGLNVGGEADPKAVYGSGFAGYLPNGTAVVVDNNISAALGAGTEDEIYFVSRSESFLWEDPSAPMLIRTETGPSMKAVGVDIVVYGYVAYTWVRQPHARKISGTGLIAPTF